MYLRMPPAWRLLGKQFLVIGRNTDEQVRRMTSKYTAEGLPFPEGKMLGRIGPMGDQDPKRVYEETGRGTAS